MAGGVAQEVEWLASKLHTWDLSSNPSTPFQKKKIYQNKSRKVWKTAKHNHVILQLSS
jgi:hypothetical protein